MRHLQDKIPIAEFVEVESGRKTERPKLKEALKECRKPEQLLSWLNLIDWLEMYHFIKPIGK